MLNKIYVKIINYIKQEYKFLIILSIIIFLGLFKLPYNLHIGGGIINIANRLKIENEYRETGSYNMSYVRSIRATIPMYLLSYVFNWDRESIDEVKLDENDTVSDIWKREKLYLQEANDNAIISAYTKAKEEINIKNEVLKVLYIDKDSQTDLAIGDTIISVNGIKINVFEDIAETIKNYSVGDRIKINYLRDDEEKEGYFTVRNINGEKKAGLYIVKFFDYDVKRNIDLDFSSREGGPSGGFMLSLAIYDRLTEDDLTKGRKVVGTGTIDRNGNVGEIGGVKYKIMGAYKGNADVFFVPEENYNEAMQYKEEKGYELNIVKVKTLDDAINYLRSK